MSFFFLLFFSHNLLLWQQKISISSLQVLLSKQKKRTTNQSRRHHLLPSEEGEEEARWLLISVLLNGIDWWRLEISSYTCHLCPSTAWPASSLGKCICTTRCWRFFFVHLRRKEKNLLMLYYNLLVAVVSSEKWGGGVFFPRPSPFSLDFRLLQSTPFDRRSVSGTFKWQYWLDCRALS